MPPMKASPPLLLALVFLVAPLAHGDPISDLAARAAQGDAAAQMELAERYFKGDGVRTDMEEALNWYSKAAELGNSDAQMKLGGIYIAGKVVRKNSAEAAKWFMLAADGGNAAAQCQMGRMHMAGAGVAKDDVEAYKWASLAAAQNDKTAKTVLAVLVKRMKPDEIALGQNQSRDYQELKKAEKTLGLPPEDPPVTVEPLPLIAPE